MPAVKCPSCGVVVHLSSRDRTADQFCPTKGCDFPLFWAQPADPAAQDGDGQEDETLGVAIRRLPGVGGRELVAPEPCPVCREPNRRDAVFCRRCGAEMHPPPPPPVVEAPAPEPVAEVVAAPEPPPARFSPLSDWRVIGVLVVMTVMLMMTGSLVLLSRS